MYEQGNAAGYTAHMIQKYGTGIAEELFLMSKHGTKTEVVEKFIEDTRIEIRLLIRKKGLDIKCK